MIAYGVVTRVQNVEYKVHNSSLLLYLISKVNTEYRNFFEGSLYNLVCVDKHKIAGDADCQFFPVRHSGQIEFSMPLLLE